MIVTKLRLSLVINDNLYLLKETSDFPLLDSLLSIPHEQLLLPRSTNTSYLSESYRTQPTFSCPGTPDSSQGSPGSNPDLSVCDQNLESSGFSADDAHERNVMELIEKSTAEINIGQQVKNMIRKDDTFW